MDSTLQEIALAIGTQVSDGQMCISRLLTDSRSPFAGADTLFFALHSERGDGHLYVADLYARGVRAFVVERIPQDAGALPEARWLLVPSVADALLALGRYAAGKIGRRVAITGSRGKTILKEWLYAMLSPGGGVTEEVARSPRSYNSQTGVPLSLWEMAPARLGLIEAGVSRPGEMERLRSCIEPDTAIFTGIGADHDEGFGSRAEKAAQKALLAGDSVKKIIYPADDPLMAEALKEHRGEAGFIGWSRKDPAAALYIKEESINPDAWRIDFCWQGDCDYVEVDPRLAPLADTLLCGLAFMLSEGFAGSRLRDAFRRLRPVASRLDVVEGVNGCSLVCDSFPADLPSLHTALDFVSRRVSGKRATVLILGGLASSDWPGAVRLMSECGVTRLMCVGAAPEGTRFPCPVEVYPDIESLLESRSPSDFQEETMLIEGIADEDFQRLLAMLEARAHETVLEVNLDAVVRNFNHFKSFLPPSTGLIAMVKASGYGAGSFEIARTLQEHHAAYLAVAVVDEGVELRRRGITMPIMVMNPKVVNYRLLFRYHLEPEIYSFDMLSDVVREAAKCGVENYPIHIKLDTGMHRMGFIGEEIPRLIEVLKGQKGVRPASVFSHLATADCPDLDSYTLRQLESFDKWSALIQEQWPGKVLRHVLNSAGIVRFPQWHYDMARLGIGLYGVETLPQAVEGRLEPVSRLRTVIVAIREWEAGETVGYGRRGVLTRRSRIATIPIGYADGMNRHFGCGAVKVLVAGKEVPTVGNICMDACMIDVTDVDCRVGDAVVIFGPEAPIQRLADAAGTIPYEILTSVSPRVKRVYYRE